MLLVSNLFDFVYRSWLLIQAEPILADLAKRAEHAAQQAEASRLVLEAKEADVSSLHAAHSKVDSEAQALAQVRGDANLTN